jgi:predicted Zn-dependent peptidase
MFKIKKLPNQLTIIVEETPGLESAAYQLLIPGGILADRHDSIGESLILGELVSRETKNYDARQLQEAFDRIGATHSESAGFDNFVFKGALLADKIEAALEIVAEMVKNATLPEGEIEPIRSLLVQDIRSVKDNPTRHAYQEFSTRYYPAPYSRPGCGVERHLLQVTQTSLKSSYQDFFRPERAILSIAGKVKCEEIFSIVEKLFEDWRGETKASLPPQVVFPPAAKYHIQADSAQEQIVVGFKGAPFLAEHYYASKVMQGVLSGGMFGRLFVEVRGKRGLCYSVNISHSARKEYGAMIAYVGTTPERAHESLITMLDVIRSVKDSIADDELARAKANLKAALVINDESPYARATSNATDYALAGRVREMREILDAISNVTKENIDHLLEAYPIKDETVLTLGAKDVY